MNILFSSLSGSDKTESGHYLRVLRRLGHQVFRFSVPGLREDPNLGFWAEPGFLPGTKLDSIIRLSGFAPDLFLYIEPNGLIPRGLERTPFPTACLLCDTHRSLNDRLKLAQFFDHVFLYHRNYLHHFHDHLPDHVHWHPYASDLEVFHPTGVKRDLDVAFIGDLHLGSERARLVSLLSERCTINEQRYYLQEEIPSVYSGAKIVLNLPLADDLNFRTFEAMSCGAMLLTRRVSNGQELLFEEGRHFVAFSDERELFDKIDYYLAHPEERETIASAGLGKIQQHHRLEQRIEELVEIIKRKPDQVAPIRRMTKSQVDKQYAWLYEFWRLPEVGLKLAREAHEAGRPWMPLLFPALRSTLRVLFR